MKRLLLAISVTAALSFSAANAIAHERHSGEHGMKAFLSQLDLSMAQKLQIRSQVSDTKDEMRVYRQDFRKLHQEMKNLMQSGNVDPASVSALLSQYQSTIKNMVKSRAKVKHLVWHNLTDEQQSKAEALKQEKLAKFSPEKREQKVAELIDSLSLSVEQEQPVMAAIDDLKVSREGMRSLVTNFMGLQREIVQANEFDDGAFDALFDEQFPLFTAEVAGMVQKRQALRQLLTLEQQEKLPAKRGMKFLKGMMRG